MLVLRTHTCHHYPTYLADRHLRTGVLAVDAAVHIVSVHGFAAFSSPAGTWRTRCSDLSRARLRILSNCSRSVGAIGEAEIGLGGSSIEVAGCWCGEVFEDSEMFNSIPRSRGSRGVRATAEVEP